MIHFIKKQPNYETKTHSYKCPINNCKMVFTKQLNLAYHMGEDHQGSSNLDRMNVSDIKTEIENYVCAVCNENFNEKISLSAHINSEHNSHEIFKSSNNSSKKLNNSEKLKISGGFECDECGKIYKSIAVLRTHKLFHGERIYKCNVEGCTSSFFTRSCLNRHGALLHKDVDFATINKIIKKKMTPKNESPKVEVKRSLRLSQKIRPNYHDIENYGESIFSKKNDYIPNKKNEKSDCYVVE